MDDSHIQEAASTADQVVGFSTYLHAIGYPVDKFKRELDDAVSHIRSQAEKAKSGNGGRAHTGRMT